MRRLVITNSTQNFGIFKLVGQWVGVIDELPAVVNICGPPPNTPPPLRACLFGVGISPFKPAVDLLRSLAHELDRVELWMDPDAASQLQLAQLLDALFPEPSLRHKLFLFQARSEIGDMNVEWLFSHWDAPLPVSEPQAEAASLLWSRFRETTPESLLELLGPSLSALPCAPAAVLRILRELPSATGGITHSQRLLLQTLAQRPRGAATLRDLRHKYARERHLLGHADWILSLAALSHCRAPAITGRLPEMSEEQVRGIAAGNIPCAAELAATLRNTRLSITQLGRDCLAGAVDFADLNPVDYWLGGIHITPDRPWRWCDDEGQLIGPC